MLKLSLPLSLFILLSLSETAMAQDVVEPEEYVVYSAMLSFMIEKSARPIETVIINDHTAIDNSKVTKPDWKLRPQRLYGVTPLLGATLDDFVSRNQHTRRLENSFNLRVKSVLVNKDEQAETWQARGGSKYSNWSGIVFLSRVGFNREKTQALLYLQLEDGLASSRTWFVLLLKEGDEWKVAHGELWWRS